MTIVNMPKTQEDMDRLIESLGDSMADRLRRTYSDFLRSRSTNNGTPPQVYIGAMIGTYKAAAIATAATIELWQANSHVEWTTEEAIADSLRIIEKEMRKAVAVSQDNQTETT